MNAGYYWFRMTPCDPWIPVMLVITRDPRGDTALMYEFALTTPLHRSDLLTMEQCGEWRRMEVPLL